MKNHILPIIVGVFIGASAAGILEYFFNIPIWVRLSGLSIFLSWVIYKYD